MRATGSRRKTDYPYRAAMTTFLRRTGLTFISESERVALGHQRQQPRCEPPAGAADAAQPDRPGYLVQHRVDVGPQRRVGPRVADDHRSFHRRDLLNDLPHALERIENLPLIQIAIRRKEHLWGDLP